MALQGNYTTTLGTPPLTAQAVLLNVYMRLSEVVVHNKWEVEYIPVPVVPATATSPEISATSKEVVTKVTRVTGRLDVYALPTDPRNGIPPLVDGREYSCAYSNASGSPLPEVQLYTHIMSLPEFAGCVAA